ncbi:hypothetical protein LCGC14_2865370, partial [marine sediment metagenome]
MVIAGETTGTRRGLREPVRVTSASYWVLMAEIREAQGDRLPEGVERVRASNPSSLTLSGTNTYLLGEPAWVIDPG